MCYQISTRVLQFNSYCYQQHNRQCQCRIVWAGIIIFFTHCLTTVTYPLSDDYYDPYLISNHRHHQLQELRKEVNPIIVEKAIKSSSVPDPCNKLIRLRRPTCLRLRRPTCLFPIFVLKPVRDPAVIRLVQTLVLPLASIFGYKWKTFNSYRNIFVLSQV